jgi:hypothetical protein
MKFADRFHFFGSLERLGVIDNEKQMAVFFSGQTSQHVQSDLLHDGRFVPIASPEEFAVVGSVGRASKQPSEPFNGTAMADGYRHDQAAEMAKCRPAEFTFNDVEKGFSFSWNIPDSNHATTPKISSVRYKTYRQDSSHFFCANYHHKFQNRSV